MEILAPAAHRVQRDFARGFVPDGAYIAFYLGPQPFVWAVTKGDKTHYLLLDEAETRGVYGK